MELEGTNLWTCSVCGTQGIAAGLGFCPNCRKEREMPAVNKAGHSTVYGYPNAAQLAAQGVGISPPKSDDPEVSTEAVDTESTGSEMIDNESSNKESESAAPEVPETKQQDPIALATEKASQAKVAFESGDSQLTHQLLDEAIELDPSRADKWTKLKDQVVGSGEQW